MTPLVDVDSKEKISKLSYKGLNKKQFLQVNSAKIEKMRKSSNAWAKKTFGSSIVALTRADIYLISNGEMGLKRNGNVHIHFGHSAGEIGLYPLPKNLSYWLDTKKTKRHTPAWNEAHSLEKNIQAFFDYMVALKNKQVRKEGSVDLYKGLFRMSGIKGNDIKEAEMLAAVVHGYFYSGVYSDKKVPIKHIAKGIKDGTPISEIMKGTTYKYANSNILVNRERNIDLAIEWLESPVIGLA